MSIEDDPKWPMEVERHAVAAMRLISLAQDSMEMVSDILKKAPNYNVDIKARELAQLSLNKLYDVRFWVHCVADIALSLRMTHGGYDDNEVGSTVRRGGNIDDNGSA